MKSGGGLMKRMSRDHLDVLQNIEFALISTWRERDDVDDRACHAAIRAVLTNTGPPDGPVAVLAMKLLGMRDLRSDITDRLWQDGLRVMAESIRTHSQRQPGEVGYLRFAGQYISG